MNFKRKVFTELMDAVGRGEISKLIVAHADRLVRFGFAWFSHFCEINGCELLVLNAETLSPQEEMVQDLMTIVDCFSSRLYGLKRLQERTEGGHHPMILAHVIALDPTAAQEEHFRKACGVARLAYNWALAEWKRKYEAGERPSAYKLKIKWNEIRRSQFPFTLEVTKCAGRSQQDRESESAPSLCASPTQAPTSDQPARTCAPPRECQAIKASGPKAGAAAQAPL
jgi:Helix-turn-helix domain/Resolvase, N terminal domain